MLSRLPSTQVKLPTKEEVVKFKKQVAHKYPYCPNVWGAVYGLNFDDRVSYFFSIGSKICVAMLNAPWNFHDSIIVDYGVYEKLEFVF